MPLELPADAPPEAAMFAAMVEGMPTEAIQGLIEILQMEIDSRG